MSSRKNQKGFTLIEILIVVGIIAVLAAIIVPNLLKGRKGANEKAVISTMKSLADAQATYFMDKDGRFGYLDELEEGGFVGLGVHDKVLDAEDHIKSFVKSNYDWTFTLGESRGTWSLAASPRVWDSDGSKHFFIDETNVVRYSDTKETAADKTSPALE